MDDTAPFLRSLTDRCTALSATGLALLLALLTVASPAAAEPVRARFVEAELVSDTKTIQPGTPFRVALRLAMEPEWHTYWENPGDTGLPTTLEWKLPKGFEAGELAFPYPHRFLAGSYVSYGYEGEVLILQEITPRADLPLGEDVYLGARAEWTVCRADLCMPGGADLGLELGVSAQAEPDGYWTNRLVKAAALTPAPPEGWKAAARVDGKTLVVTLTAETDHDPGTIEVYEKKAGLIDHETAPKIASNGTSIEITLELARRKAPERVDLVLAASKGWSADGSRTAIAVSAPVTAH
ncbi:MAG: protein-disulfide reductase DsbD domain-containing protein [Candidatus Binatia bacterium]